MIRSAIVYLFNKPFNVEAASLNIAVQDFKFNPCGPQDISKFGFSQPTKNNGDNLCHFVSGITMLTTMKEEKIIPAQYLKDLVNEAVAKIEYAEARKLPKKEKESIKDDVISSLLPRAFSKKTPLNYYIVNLEFGQVIIVDTTSYARAEEGLALLRKSVGSLPIIPLSMKESVSHTLTNIAKEQKQLPSFPFTGFYDLSSESNEGSAARMKDFESNSDELALHLENEKIISGCSLSYWQSMEFKIDDSLIFKSIKFSEEFKAGNDEMGNEDPLARFDADLTLAISEVKHMINDIVRELGGIERGNI